MGVEPEPVPRRGRLGDSVILRLIPYFLLAVGVAVTLEPAGEGPAPVALALSAATVLWLLWFDTHPQWHETAAVMGVYYAGLASLTAGLVAIAPWYGFFAWVGYPLAFRFLKGRWMYVGASVTAVTSALAVLGGLSAVRAEGLWWEWLGVSLVSMVLSGALFHFFHVAGERELHEANRQLEDALAENAGLHAQLLVQAREAGVQDERQRTAREIHDTLAQGLAGILTQVQAAEQALDERPAARRHLANARELARESLGEARRTVLAVEPAVLADARLPDAIGEVARRWADVNDVAVALTTTGDARPMHAEVEVTLLRAAQEALANVAKHAQAARVGLTLSYMEDLVTLDVRDDGVGFTPGATRSAAPGTGGLGLAGLRRRVQRLAGRLEIESEPGGGTAISATVPAIPAGTGE
ncbi:signal transduction histidine kinase [Amycolatopsis sulphurea]|uniref:Oxygen sensor histidine kinase NreB n=1 Tax=Amycolatopsis sulphurea TaxID=76022 RepID=A0A2A9G3W2_9PSEU|nr:sensor histidine kinase [Amycolatopsis sulphurea]PFG57591.1 signal transduction histidine kinase [Amycolatopsis sulphurea]